MIKHRKINGTHKLQLDTKWLSFYEIAELEPAISRGLTGQILLYRYVNGNCQTWERLLRKKQRYKAPDPDAWAREGASDEEWAALQSGSNQKLLNL